MPIPARAKPAGYGTTSQADGNRRPKSAEWDWLRSHPEAATTVLLGAALLVRAAAAAGTFLNPDEVLHFSVANQDSWLAAYHSSFSISHPPLLPLVLHFWRIFGDSEFVLRLPSVLLGTAFCWVFFRWLSNLFGPTAGWIGLILAGFLPPMVALSAEVRQYALLLFFSALALYWLERALEENSAAIMLASVFCLYLALLSHYSAGLFAAAMGIYGALRLLMGPAPFSRSVITVWAVGQAVGAGLCLFLYLTSVKALAEFFQGQPLRAWMGETYLHNSYYDPERHHVLLFIASRTGSVFQYLFGQDAIGDLAFLGFIVALILLMWNRSLPAGIHTSQPLLATLLALPFGLNCAAALAGHYPYGGTRHCVFLVLFALAAVSFSLSRVAGQRPGRATVLAIVIVVLCYLFPSRRLPYIARTDQNRAHMLQAVSFLQRQVPSSDVIFVDNQTSLLLAHYLCRQQVFSVYQSMRTFNSFQCGGHPIIATRGDAFFFTAKNFFPNWNHMVRAYRIPQGSQVWVLQEGWLWGDSLARQLQAKYPNFRDLNPLSFGHNITIFKLTVPPNGELL